MVDHWIIVKALFMQQQVWVVRKLHAPYLVREEAKNIKTRFLENQLKSKPIGFYTWTDELSQIFQQDRLVTDMLRSKK